MSDVVVAADFGSSLGRAIFSLSPSPVKPELVLFDPEVVEVPQQSIENYEKYRVGESPPEDSSWVKLGESYLAVGFLAKSRFHTVHCRNSLKVDSALPLTLAMLGAIAVRGNLPESFRVSLGIVLPFSEFRDRQKFHTILAEALQDLTYRGRNYQIELKQFLALPEGGGLSQCLVVSDGTGTAY